MNLNPNGANLATIPYKAESPELEPKYAHGVEDAGCDLRANIQDTLTIQPGCIAWVPTGVCLAMPDGVFALQCPRSGLACNHGVTLANAPGVIDPGYRGEVKCVLINHGPRPYTVYPGERIAQLVFLPFISAVLDAMDELPLSRRGADGYGSTGAM